MGVHNLDPTMVSVSPFDEVPNKQDGTDGDRRVRQVECRVVPVVDMEQNEINDITVQNPVDGVTHGTPENEAQCDREYPQVSWQTEDPVHDHDRDDACECQKQIIAPSALAVHETEGCTPVVDPGECEKRQDPDPAAGRENGFDPALAPLVEDNHKNAQ